MPMIVPAGSLLLLGTAAFVVNLVIGSGRAPSSALATR